MFLLRTLLVFEVLEEKILKMVRQSLGRDILFCFVSLSKFGSLNNPFTTITSLSELHFRHRRFILLIETKVVFFLCRQGVLQKIFLGGGSTEKLQS